jgi:hypothetical protein
MEDNNQTELQTELDFLFQNSPTNCIEEPEFEFSNINKKENLTETTQTNSLVEPLKKRHPKRFFYNDDYEIYYLNRKN